MGVAEKDLTLSPHIEKKSSQFVTKRQPSQTRPNKDSKDYTGQFKSNIFR